MNIKQHIKETFNLGLPVSIGYLGHIMLGVVDSLMIGQVGAVQLAASSLVNSLFILVLVFGIGMTIAVTPLVAIARGSEKKNDCGIYLRQSLLLNSIIALLLLIVSYFLADFIHLMNQPPEIIGYAKSYLRILSFSILPFMIFQTYRQFIEGLGHTKPAMYINVFANLFNAFFNWVFIYGNLGFPRLELDGAGYASTLTRVFMGLSIFLFVIRSDRYKEYDPSLKFRSINLPVMKKLLSIGLPTGMQMFFEVSAFSFAAIMIGWIGTTELAAHQIAISLASATFMIILGIGAAATIRVGHALGKRDLTNVRTAGFTAIALGIFVMSIFGITFIMFRDFLPSLYINDTKVISVASTLLIVAAVFQIFDGTQAVGLGVLRGMTDVKVPMIMTFAAYWIIGIPLGYLLGFTFQLGVVGIWISLSAGLIFAAFFFTIRFLVKSKRA